VIEVFPYLGEGMITQQPCWIFFNGLFVHYQSIKLGSEMTFVVSRDLASPRTNRLSFTLPNAASLQLNPNFRANSSLMLKEPDDSFASYRSSFEFLVGTIKSDPAPKPRWLAEERSSTVQLFEIRLTLACFEHKNGTIPLSISAHLNFATEPSVLLRICC
jgi:hypothetical protein